MARRRGNPGPRSAAARRTSFFESLEPRQLLTAAPGASPVSPSGDQRIDTLLAGSKWDVVNITYSFYDGGGYYGSEANPTPVSTAVRDNVRMILSTIISPLVNLTFTEVPDSPTNFGTLRYLCSTTPDYAWGYYPSGSNVGGDVLLRTSSDVADPNNNNSFRNGIGSHGFQTLIHETCHALGLKHPGDYNLGGTSQPPFLPFAQDNWDNSLMTYNFSSGKEPASPMAYDVLALGYMYGAKTATRGGDTTYTFTTADVWAASDGSSAGSVSRRSKNTLWDGGGTDTFDLSGLPAAASGYRIDLNPGGWLTPTSSYNTARYDATTGSPTTFPSGTTYAATDHGTRLALAGSTIENVIASGSSDSIFVNAAANQISGYAPGFATGADMITGADQADTLDLSKFLESGIVKSQVGDDLVLNLGSSTGTVTVKDFYAVALGSRISIVYAAPPLPVLVITTASADKMEGTGSPASTPFTFTVSRSSDLNGTSTVSWAVAGSGSNPANAADFTGGGLPSGTASFAAGEFSKTITVNVATDGLVEADEGFTVTLSSPSGATLGMSASATCTIRNDDFPPPPALAIIATSADKPEGSGPGTTQFTFTVSRSGDLIVVSSVSWAVNGSGLNPANAADFGGGVLPTGSVNFAAGESSKTITVNVAADALAETDEGFTIMLRSPSGATLGAVAQATGTIRNDDYRSLISIAATDAVKSEGDVGRTPFTFTLTRTGGLSGEVSLPWSTVGSGSNRADRFDFIGGVLPSGTIRLAAGRQTQTLTLNVLCDRIAEFDEQFTINLGTPLGGLDGLSTGARAAIGTIKNDDPGTPKPAAAVLIQGQAFAALAEAAGSSPSNNSKRGSFGGVGRV